MYCVSVCDLASIGMLDEMDVACKIGILVHKSFWECNQRHDVLICWCLIGFKTVLSDVTHLGYKFLGLQVV